MVHAGEQNFIPRSYGVNYLTLVKKFDMSLEKDYFDHLVFKWKFFYFQWGTQKSFRNSILLYKVIYFSASWNFACIVSELEIYVSDKCKKFIKNQEIVGVFL